MIIIITVTKASDNNLALNFFLFYSVIGKKEGKERLLFFFIIHLHTDLLISLAFLMFTYFNF